MQGLSLFGAYLDIVYFIREIRTGLDRLTHAVEPVSQGAYATAICELTVAINLAIAVVLAVLRNDVAEGHIELNRVITADLAGGLVFTTAACRSDAKAKQARDKGHEGARRGVDKACECRGRRHAVHGTQACCKQAYRPRRMETK